MAARTQTGIWNRSATTPKRVVERVGRVDHRTQVSRLDQLAETEVV
jgi:hypothetical protein